MKKILLSLVAIVMMASCNNNKQTVVRQTGSSQTIKTEVNSDLTDEVMVLVKQGLPADMVSQLLTESEDLAAFEDALNVNGGINNLDLDGDGNQDQLAVQDISTDAAKKLAILGVYNDGNVNLMEFKMVQNGESYSVECYPNESYYGYDSYYHSNYHRGNGYVNGMMLGYLFSPRYRYYTPRYYSYGYYGGAPIVRYRTVGYSQYRARPTYSRVRTSATKRYSTTTSRPSTYKKSYTVKKKSSTAKAPNKTSKRSSVTNQTKSSKSFQKGSNSKSNTGWGTKPSTTTKKSSDLSKKSTTKPSTTKPASSSFFKSKNSSSGNSGSSGSKAKSSSSKSKSSSWGSSSKSKSSSYKSSSSSSRSSSRSSSKRR